MIAGRAAQNRLRQNIIDFNKNQGGGSRLDCPDDVQERLKMFRFQISNASEHDEHDAFSETLRIYDKMLYHPCVGEVEEVKKEEEEEEEKKDAWPGLPQEICDDKNMNVNSKEVGAPAALMIKIGYYCGHFVNHPILQGLIIGVICAAGLLVGIQTYENPCNSFGSSYCSGETPCYEEDSISCLVCDKFDQTRMDLCTTVFKDGLSDGFISALNYVDACILVIFCIELVLVFIACRDRPWEFIWVMPRKPIYEVVPQEEVEHEHLVDPMKQEQKRPIVGYEPHSNDWVTAEGLPAKGIGLQMWNVFDFVVVLACMPFMPSAISNNAQTLRILRLLRTFKLMKKIPRLQVILSGLGAGLESISYILLLMLLVFYMFAIVCVSFFNRNDKLHFENLQVAMLSLFRMSTMEDWTDIMYINMFGCDRFEFYTSMQLDEELGCNNAEGSGSPNMVGLLFVIFIVINGLVIMSLFIGIISTSMAEANDAEKFRSKQERDKVRRVEFLARAEALKNESDTDKKDDEEGTVIQAPREGYAAFAHKVDYLCESNGFQSFIIIIICICGVTVGIQTYELSDGVSTFLVILDYFFLFIFIVECAMKVIAQGAEPWRFFLDGWNVLDFVVVVLCLYSSIRDLGSDGGEGNYIAVLRLLRLTRLAKLFNNVRSLQAIVVGLGEGIASLGYISLLFFLGMYIYAVVGMVLFQENDPVHFYDMQTTMITLFRVATMEDWTDVMYIQMYGCQRYDFGNLPYSMPIDEEGYCWSPQSSSGLSPLYFVTFLFITGLVMLNLVIGTMTASMSDVEERFKLEDEIDSGVKKLQERYDIGDEFLNNLRSGFRKLDVDGTYNISITFDPNNRSGERMYNEADVIAKEYCKITLSDIARQNMMMKIMDNDGYLNFVDFVRICAKDARDNGTDISESNKDDYNPLYQEKENSLDKDIFNKENTADDTKEEDDEFDIETLKIDQIGSNKKN